MCCVVFECDPISSKQINFATARQNEYISRSATLNAIEHILFYLILKSSTKKFAFSNYFKTNKNPLLKFYNINFTIIFPRKKLYGRLFVASFNFFNFNYFKNVIKDTKLSFN